MALTTAQSLAVRALLGSLVEAVQAAGPTGAPGGLLYAALLGKMTLEQFETCMAALVQAGNLRKTGDLYIFVKAV